MKISLLILPHHLPQLHTTQNTPLEDSAGIPLYKTTSCSAVPMKRALHQIAAHSLEEQNHLHQHSITTWALRTPSKMLQQKKKKIFPQPHWMMTFDLKIQFWIDICVFMKSNSHTSCVLIPVHTAWICYHPLQKTPQQHTMR